MAGETGDNITGHGPKSGAGSDGGGVQGPRKIAFKATTETRYSWKESEKSIKKAIIERKYRIPFYVHNLAEDVDGAIDQVFPDDALAHNTSTWRQPVVQMKEWTSPRAQGLRGVSMEKALVHRYKESMCDFLKTTYQKKAAEGDMEQTIQHKDHVEDKVKFAREDGKTNPERQGP